MKRTLSFLMVCFFTVAIQIVPASAGVQITENDALEDYYSWFDFDEDWSGFENYYSDYTHSEGGLKWDLSDDGCLTISGQGAMNDYIREYEWSNRGSSLSWTSPKWKSYADEVKSINIEEGVTSVGSGAFREFSNLTAVHLPDSIETIGHYAFDDCKNLKTINFPNNMVSIGVCSFHGCSSLKKIILSENLICIGDGAFDGCSILDIESFPEKLVYIGEEAFRDCKSISNITIRNVDRYSLPMESTNINHHDYYEYINWGANDRSYLYAEGNEYIRIEQISGIIVLERYSKEYKLISAHTIESDFSAIWGGLFCGEKYNFIVYGYNNPQESNQKEVVRIVKFNKDWEELDRLSVNGANTFIPFRAGSLRFAEVDDLLYIHTSHEMFKTTDGMHHQANMTFVVRESTMKMEDSRYSVSNNATGYVSHSFNQYILVDQEQNIITLDHGDAYPRSIVLMKYQNKADLALCNGIEKIVDIQTFPGEGGQNFTGASVGGLAETVNDYITVYNYNGDGSNVEKQTRNIYMSFTDKNNFSDSGTKTTKITSYPDNGTYTIGNPMIVPVNLEKGYVLWSEKRIDSKEGYDNSVKESKVSYVIYSADGTISPVKTVDAQLSDCQPLVDHGKLVWYVTDHSAPTFYELDERGIQTYRIGSYMNLNDVGVSEYYFKPIGWAMGQGITLGTSDTTFSPDVTCTRGQAVTFLWRAAGSEKVTDIKNPFTDVSSSDFYYHAVLWAYKNGITTGVTDSTFNPNGECNRGQIVTFLWRSERKPSAKASIGFADVKRDAYYYDPVRWAVENNVTNGTSINTFSPEASCTRGQIVTFLYRDLA